MNIKEGYISFNGYKTYYRIVNPNGKKTPLLMCHGGPGSTHTSFEVIDDLALKDDRPIIMYDQIGCGLSSLDSPHPNLWKKETWIEELINLRSALNLTKIHLLGHSWGGMLAIIYLCDYHPYGIKSAILSSTLSSANLWKEETHRLIHYLPQCYQDAILDAEKNNDFSALEFQNANIEYKQKFIGGPWSEKDPECLTRPKKIGEESYLAAWGPCEFAPSGTLKDYEYTDKLSSITCPILLCSGADDESTPYQNKIMYDTLTCSKKWVLFNHSRHMSYAEEHDRYVETLINFLNEND